MYATLTAGGKNKWSSRKAVGNLKGSMRIDRNQQILGNYGKYVIMVIMNTW